MPPYNSVSSPLYDMGATCVSGGEVHFLSASVAVVGRDGDESTFAN